jgi:ELWxxDGT repeat protein
MLLKSTFWLFCFLMAGICSAQELVKDFNLSQGQQGDQLCMACGGYVYFTATNGQKNGGQSLSELWRTDGTNAGTVQLTSAYTKGNGVFPSAWTCAGSQLLFYSLGWWKTDGTTEGTVPAYPFWAATPAELTNNILSFEGDGSLYIASKAEPFVRNLVTQFAAAPGTAFQASLFSRGDKAFIMLSYFDLSLGKVVRTELWVFDEMTGLQLLATFEAQIYITVLANGKLFFTGYDSMHGYQPWASDGTIGGTVKLGDITPVDPNSSGIIGFPWLLTVGDNAVFSSFASKQTWISEGTPETTVKLLGDFAATTAAQLDNTLYFAGYTPDGGAGVVRINKNMTSAQETVAHSLVGFVPYIANANDKVVFPFPTPNGIELVASDNSTSGYTVLKDINPGVGSSSPHTFASNGSTAVFLADDGVHGVEFWTTDGTAAGTTLLRDISVGSASSKFSDFLVTNKKLHFFVTPQSDNPTQGFVPELWTSDGSTQGTYRVKHFDFVPTLYTTSGSDYVGVGISVEKLNAETGDVVELSGPLNTQFNGVNTSAGSPSIIVGNKMYFYIASGVNSQTNIGWELCVADFDTGEVKLVKDIYAGAQSSLWKYADTDQIMVSLGDKVVFGARNENGVEPWVTDGTESGTMMLKDINTNDTDPFDYAFPYSFTPLGNKLLFTAKGNTAIELWITDGTPVGTSKLMEIDQDKNVFHELVVLNDRVYFSGAPNGGTYGVWSTAGAPGDVQLLKGMPSTNGGNQSIGGFTTHAGKLVFNLVNTFSGYEFWTSDGTEAGTQKLEYPGLETGGNFYDYVSDGDWLYFGHAAKIWRSKLTAETTEILGDGFPDGKIYVLEDYVVFVASSGQFGKELFRLPLGNKTSQTITGTTDYHSTMSSAPFFVDATASSGLPLSFTSSDESVVTVSQTGQVTIKGLGQAYVTATQGGNEDYYAANPLYIYVTVEKLPQSITFDPVPGKTMLDVPFSIVATASSSLPVAIAVSDPTILSISNSIATIRKPGTVTITITQAGNNTYLPASATQDVTITKVEQTITFPEIDPRSAADSVFYASAFASSNLPLQYSSSDPLIATIDQAGQIRIKKAGTVSITASQNGNDVYEAATAVTHALEAMKADQVISLLDDGIQRFVFDAPFTVRYTNSSGIKPTFSSSDETVAKISKDGLVTILSAGNITINATQSGNEKYNAATPATLDLTIYKRTQVITFPSMPPAGFLSKNIRVPATASSGLALTYTWSDEGVAKVEDNGDVTIFDVGTVTFTAFQAGNDFYEPATPVSQTFEATKEKQTISFVQVLDKRADAAPFQFNASTSSNLPVSFTSVDPLVAAITNEGMITVLKSGVALINLNQEGDERFLPADPVHMRFNVLKQNQHINGFFFIQDHPVAEDHFTLDALTSTSGLPVKFRVVQGTSGQIRLNGDNVVTLLSAGKATIVAEQSGNDIYAAADAVSATFCVLPEAPILRQAIVSGETILTSSVPTNVWILDAKVIDFTGQSYTAHLPGKYQVIANFDGCIDGYSNTVTVGDITGLEEESVTGVHVFPNPTEKNITIRYQLPSQIRIIDLAGKELINQTTSGGESVFDVSSFAAGVYVVIINDHETTHHAKFIKR